MSFSSNFPTIAPSLNLDFANTKVLDPRITFSRASTATFYDGVTVAKAEENLLLQSQTFNTTWAITNATITADSTAAPDGTTTAETLTASATPARGVSQNPNVFSLAYTISIFAKAGTLNFVFIREYITNNAEKVTYFDLSLGTVGTTAAGHTASISSFGNGWYRCIVTCTPDAARSQLVQFGGCDANGSLTVTTGGTIYIWGAQLEQRSAVTAYTATTTQPITNYIPVLRTAAAGVARFNHNPTTGESLGLEIEEQRTNLLTYSEDFSNAAWTKTAATITSNAAIAPDGTLTGDKLVGNSTTTDTEKFTNRSIYSYVGQTVTGSVYLKKGEYTWAQVNLFNTTPYANRVWINLDTGAVGTNLSSIPVTVTSMGNGWYRVALTATIQSTGNAFITIALADADGDLYTNIGNQYSGTYIWGAQLEAGAFATSYIPTVASSVTRSTDAASMTGNNFSQWYRADEGTLYLEGTANTTGYSASMNDNSSSNAITLVSGTSGTAFWVDVSGVSQAAIGTRSLSMRYAGAYKANDIAFSSAGGVVATATTATIPVVSQLNIGTRSGGSGPISGTIKKIAYYPLRLTNAQLQALTS